MPWIFATDLHGRLDRYEKLLAAVEAEPPTALLLGGDLLPSLTGGAFLVDWLQPRLEALRERLGRAYPPVLAIFGNDDPRSELPSLRVLEKGGLLRYAHDACVEVAGFAVCGYACVPPTPFLLKDWERYDVSRYVDPGCVSPEEGRRSVPVGDLDARWSTIAADLERLAATAEPSRTVFLFHAPPHGTALDLAALGGRRFEHAPLDPHVGSIAIRRFVEQRQPLVTLHGHVHEAARLSGSWRERLGRSWCFTAAHDGDELALVAFDPERPDAAIRQLL